MSTDGLPLPPFELATRVGSLQESDDPWGMYDSLGRAIQQDLLAALPAGFSLEGRRILDFGCGAGRTLRHFVGGEYGGEFWGCDIDAASIAWLEENLSPPLFPFLSGELPPLPQPDEMFDVIYCVSVFTHLSRSWSSWLLELHRVLKPDGILLATFMGEGQSLAIAGERWDEGKVGMLTLSPGQSWDRGGPMILHSPWWIREHWGRLFEVVSLTPHGFASEPGTGHGMAVLRKKATSLTVAELEAPSSDPREAPALVHNVDRLIRELEDLRPAWEGATAELATLRQRTSVPAAEHGDGQPAGVVAPASPRRSLRRLLSRSGEPSGGD
ncbi:MAG TPA: class I SAM-dependent methyltransferase [Thermoleophilaceae bacterium]|nr:class I SAM-dependent methyltransferase [Thermoleophilaceae bacterium]